jgi:2-oxo-4-hydroxy-4-carboxy-5-ureidoimidazoline decarboxylase
MNAILSEWNKSDMEVATAILLSCCSAPRWAQQLVAMRPFPSDAALFSTADEVWAQMQEADWMQAFLAHPRIGERKAAQASAQSSRWSGQEQATAQSAKVEVLDRLATGNALYEEKFGFTYIVCATGKSAEEMLAILESRLTRDKQSELQEAAEQQRQIMQLRLRKWLQL